jgi:hypothetical protein
VFGSRERGHVVGKSLSQLGVTSLACSYRKLLHII